MYDVRASKEGFVLTAVEGNTGDFKAFALAGVTFEVNVTLMSSHHRVELSRFIKYFYFYESNGLFIYFFFFFFAPQIKAEDGVPISGVLLSLSGASFRSNMLTQDTGLLTFNNLVLSSQLTMVIFLMC